ncbi:Uma2 family endonuclease [Moorena producens JHB]|uniref:Uma2 family endonuclease n=1 Tax=Moorena producens (strain JHB) TaxID=1454205 RepID=A0A1D9G480_MOOP1|nr:Uma2 family endonuclease [Moorena producens]AOY82457.1 Uma2 family endonuclease [Moorena producens JHB]
MADTTTINQIRFTTADLDLLTDDGHRYEVIDGDLLVTRSPHWNHNKVVGRLYSAVDSWSLSDKGYGEAVLVPGIVFDQENAVEPDAVWVSDKNRLPEMLDQAGHLTEAPDLIIESLSPGSQNERRDREVKLKLYSVRGVREYWIVDWRTTKLEVYLRQNAKLTLVETLFPGDILRSHLLPGFELELQIVFL